MCTSSVALVVMLLVFTLGILLGQKFLITIICRKYSKYYDYDKSVSYSMFSIFLIHWIKNKTLFSFKTT